MGPAYACFSGVAFLSGDDWSVWDDVCVCDAFRLDGEALFGFFDPCDFFLGADDGPFAFGSVVGGGFVEAVFVARLGGDISELDVSF